MAIFEGKSPAERNKIIAAMVLGALAVISLTYTFSGLFVGSKTTVLVTANASPTASVSPNGSPNSQSQVSVPNQEEIYSVYTTIPVVFNGTPELGSIGGRNIFAFYEPPTPLPPTPYVPTPTISPIPYVPPPLPDATPYPIELAYISPQSTYAGSKTFRIEATGDRFTPESKIVLNGTPVQTTFVSPQKLYADVSANFIRNAGVIGVIVDTFDGKTYSQQLTFNVQAPPKPQIEYIGMIARRLSNNDTAYFEQKGNDEPVGKRLNDVVDGRFRLISISEREVEVEDVRLGFKHKIAMKRPDPATYTDTPANPSSPIMPNRRTIPNNRIQQPATIATDDNDCIPGIPCDIPRATPNPNTNTNNPNVKIRP